MCGISGIITKNSASLSRAELEKMTDIILHRGPDAGGYYLHDTVGFGHRRLSILDLSELGAQPMYWEDKYVITYNGEVYNYLEIKEELITYGYQFKSNSDTEVILAAYDKWGKDCVSKFNGMWSFAIHDKIHKQIFCSRDRFGIKPFHYALIDDKFVFGSEIKQILLFFEKNVCNLPILLDYLILSLESHTNETFFKDIYSLSGGHNLTFDLSTFEFKIERYYAIGVDESLKGKSEGDSIDIWSKEFKRSINYRLRSDVKVGTCLSGGLDSSSVASVSSEIYQKQANAKMIAITAESEDLRNSEVSYAKLVVENANLDWKIVKPTLEDFEKMRDKIIYVMEEPFGGVSVIMQYFVFEEANKNNCKVLLDGQGGDETLLGYERYYPAYLMHLPIRKRTSEFLSSVRNSKLSFLKLLMFSFYFTNYKLRLRRLYKKHNYLKKEFRGQVNIDKMKDIATSYKNILQLQKNELETSQLPHLLKYEDRNSMWHSVESRLPFLDYKLVETSLSVNNSLKIKDGWTKYILRKAMVNYLPKEIAFRKNKLGFEAPDSIWMKKKDHFYKAISNSPILNKILNLDDLKVEDLDNKTVWKLYNIAHWEIVYEVQLNEG